MIAESLSLTQQLATALISLFEGRQLVAYQDTADIWTIGYGHTGPEVCQGMMISEEQANQLLIEDQAPLFNLVANKPPTAAAAYVSFGYNCGIGALKRVLAGQAKLTDFVHDHIKNEQPGLVKRRRLEALLIKASQ